ncbi:glycine oxidase ThiO [Gloeothece citriformis PCC 7424]|uniref:Thiazole synthase n=1 Tax=Gloeothece citriformis (strain PCC 7424) TaxID=65393 RepID=B7K9N9_GLOC7|nr:glycine oxidase ThiO [Gloeothece citriformis]ACK70007.1 glycine oxidase ThiO [Gloeothece citriformis PCC 7424]
MNSSSEIVIIGGGIIGLAIAVDLKLRGATVTVISQDFQQAASHAAAGMLAPHAEELPPGAMLDLCLKSRWLYPEWVRKLQDLSALEVGYIPCGILAPVFDIPKSQGDATWLDKEGINHYQPGLGSEVVGGWWYPEDGQVDNRQLMKALHQAAQRLGVNVLEGVTVEAIAQKQGKVSSILTSRGEIEGQTYVLASGSWVNQLLPLPVRPVKGQMLSLRMPREPHQPLPLQRVLYGPGTYLVPRQDGRLIIGATVEEVNWTSGNTPNGIKTLLDRAIRLYPALENWPIEEFWWGFRPGTPDELPILGRGFCDNLVLATGHYRNGILLAPVTASLIADLILQQKTDPLLSHFRYDRFFSKPLSTPMNTNGTQPLQFASVNGSSSIPQLPEPSTEDHLIIAGRKFRSRLMTGTGKYPSIEAMQKSVIASECEIVTVAVRRVQTKAPGHEGLAEAIDWGKIWMLPNTAGCKTAEDAIRVARLGREMAKLLGQEDNNFIKLEVIPDPKYLLPDPIGTLQAAEQLVKEGFAVLPYINADPLLAKRLEEVGCATVMPLGSPIGSGQGIKNEANIAIIIEQSKIPVVVDAGIGTPSEAALAMEMGADALLVNSAIALSKNPPAMAKAMGMAAQAGRLAYLAGRMPLKSYASASSPLTGTVV